MKSCARFLIVLLAIFALLPAARSAAVLSPAEKWFGAGQCATFNSRYGRRPPYTKPQGEEHLAAMPSIPPPSTLAIAVNYVYDPVGIALRNEGQDSADAYTLCPIGMPLLHVQTADLSVIHTMSGVKLGMSADALVRLLASRLS